MTPFMVKEKKKKDRGGTLRVKFDNGRGSVMVVLSAGCLACGLRLGNHSDGQGQWSLFRSTDAMRTRKGNNMWSMLGPAKAASRLQPTAWAVDNGRSVSLSNKLHCSLHVSGSSHQGCQ